MVGFLAAVQLAALASLAAAAPAAEAVPGVLSFPVYPMEVRNDHPKKRQTCPRFQNLTYRDGQYRTYMMDVKVGDPWQKMRLSLESSRSETWLVTPDNCGHCSAGSFDTSKSKSLGPIIYQQDANLGDPTTYPPSNQTFRIDVHTDRFEIAGVELDKQPIGVIRPGTTGNGIGLLGLGPDLHQGYQLGKPYNTILDGLYTQGAIASRAYSLALRGPDTDHGAILFGGYDVGKFSGKLNKVPLVNDELGTKGPSIVLSGLGQRDANGTQHTYQIPQKDHVFLIDSGNQYLRLRLDFVEPLMRDLGAINDGNNAFFVDCDRADDPGSWDFNFGGTIIKVPYSSLITPFTNQEGTLCEVGTLITTGGQLVLGQSFMEAAYLAFDFDNKQLGLAPAADCGSEVHPFGTGANVIPDVTGCPNVKN